MNRQLWPFAALSAGYFAHIGFFNPYLPLWLQDMGFGLLTISLLVAMQSATRLVAPYAWAWLSDHTGKRVWLLRYCAMAALTASLGLWWVAGVSSVFWVLLIMFLHTGGMLPLSEAVLAHRVTHEGQFNAQLYGRIRLWGSLGFLVTVLWAGYWFEQRGLTSFPMWSSATLLVVVLSVMFMPELKEPLHTSPQPPGEMGRMLKQPRVRWFFLGMFFHILSHIFLYIFFSLYLDSLGYSKTIIGMLWGFGVVVEVMWFFTQGRWLPLMPLTGWLVLASSLMAGRMLVTATLPHVLWLLFAVQALHAITFAAHHSVSIALLSDFFPARTRARGQALYSVVGYGLSGVVAGLLGGWASTTFGLQSVFWLSCGAALLAILAYQALQRNGITVDPKAHHNSGSGG